MSSKLADKSAQKLAVLMSKANFERGLLLEQHAFLNFTTIPNEIFVLFAEALKVLAGLLIVFRYFSTDNFLIYINLH